VPPRLPFPVHRIVPLRAVRCTIPSLLPLRQFRGRNVRKSL